MPVIPWQVEPTSHAFLLSKQIKTILVEEAPRVSKRNMPKWMSSSTVAFIKIKASYIKACSKLKKKHFNVMRKAFFLMWVRVHRGRGEWEVGSSFVSYIEKCIQDFEFKYRWTKSQAAKIQRMLHKSLGNDRSQRLDEIIKTSSSALSDKDLREGFKNIRKLEGFVPRFPPSIQNEDGTNATTPEAIRGRWVRHWCQLFAGKVCDFGELVHEEWENIKSKGYRSFVDDSLGIPLISNLQKAFRKVNPFKAHGEDGIPNKVMKFAARAMAKVYYPLHLKTSLTCNEPLQNRGNNSHELRKPKVPLSKGTKAFRGIGIADTQAKVFHKGQANFFSPFFLSKIRGCAHGGIKKRGIDFAVHTVSALQRYARNRNKSSALFFIDIIFAFDALDRRIMFDGEESVFRQLFGEGRVQETLASSFARSWTTTQGVAEVIRTTLGSRPGDPWADKVFTILVTWGLNRVGERALDAGIGFKVELRKNGTVLSRTWGQDEADNDSDDVGGVFAAGLGEPREADLVDGEEQSYVDDIVFIILADTAAQCVEQLERLAVIVTEEFTKIGLVLNFSEGKSEAIVHLVGEKSRDIMDDIVNRNDSCIPFTVNNEHKLLRVVESYLYLGTILHRKCLQSPEFASRSHKTFVKMFSDLMVVFKSDWATDEQKEMLVSTMLTTKMLSNGHVWGPAPEPQTRILEVARSKIVRYATGKFRSSKDAQSAIPDKFLYVPYTSFLRVKDCLRKQRLQYLHRFLTYGTPLLHAAVQAESMRPDSWAHQVREDLMWIHGLDERLSSLPSPAALGGLRKWEAFVLHKGGVWKEAVRQVFHNMSAGQCEVAVDKDPYWEPMPRPFAPGGVGGEGVGGRDGRDGWGSGCKCGRRHLSKRPCLQAARLHEVCYEDKVPRGQMGRCPFCPAVLPNNNRYICHLVECHAHRAPERQFAPASGICPACLGCFWTRPRLLAHLAGKKARGSKCFRHLVLSGCQPISAEKLEELDAEDRVLVNTLRAKGRACKASEGKVYCRAPGPQPDFLQGPMPSWTARVPLQEIL